MSYVFDLKTGRYRRTDEYQQERQAQKKQEAHRAIEAAKDRNARERQVTEAQQGMQRQAPAQTVQPQAGPSSQLSQAISNPARPMVAAQPWKPTTVADFRMLEAGDRPPGAPLVSGGTISSREATAAEKRRDAGTAFMKGFETAPLTKAAANLFTPDNTVLGPKVSLAELERAEFEPRGAQWAPYVAGAALGEAPTVAAAYLTGGAAGTAALGRFAPQAPWLAKMMARGLGAGAVHGGMRAAAEGQSLPEAGKTIATEAALFGVGDPAVVKAGQLVKTAVQRGIQGLKEPLQLPQTEALNLTKAPAAALKQEPVTIAPQAKAVTPRTPPPAAKEVDVQPGDTVYGKAGNQRFTVVDSSDPAMLTVKNETGNQLRIGRKAVNMTAGEEASKVQQPQDVTPEAVPRLARQSDISPGDTVYRLDGKKLAVLDVTDNGLLTVQNEAGRQYKIGRKAIKTEPPGGATDTGQSALSKVEAELGHVVDEQIGDVRPAVGMSVKITGRGKDTKQAGKFASVDPDVEARWQASRGVPKEPVIDRARQSMSRLFNLATREFEHLPRTGEFSRLRFDLSRLKKQRDVTGDRALRIIQGLTIKQDQAKHDLFTRKVILDDLKQEAAAGRKLPFGYTPETLEKDLQRVNAELGKHTDVLQAVEARKKVWDAIKADYIKTMQDIGFDAGSRLTKEDYYRHQVLEFANLKRMVSGTGKKLSTPTKSGFLRHREGSELDINTDYLQTESQVMADMLYSTEVARTIRSVDRNYNIANRLKQQYGKDWEQHIPEGYTTWQPREGNIFYFTDSVPAAVAEKLYSGAIEELGVKAGDLRKALAMGQRFREFVVKEEVAATLNNLTTMPTDNPISQASKTLQRNWKVWTLISPRRWFRYNFRNISGDADAAFAGNPSTFKKTPRAIGELYQVFTGDKSMTPDMKDWFERGGMQTLLQAQELGDVNKLKMFVQLQEKKGSLVEMPIKAWQGYWKAARLSTDFREAILRYSAYLDYSDQMRKNNGRPKNFGASIPEEVMALDDIKDRAFKLSNELLGAYDQVGVLGQALREHLIPFWSWNEVNFRRYKQLMINAARDGELAHTVGRKLLGGAVRTPMIAYRVGALAMKASALWVMLDVWNNTRFPELEKGLSAEERNRPHIIFGQDEDGNTLYFSRLGALQDFVDWFGVDAGTVRQVQDVLNGKKSVKEVAVELAKRPVNKLAQGITPFIKAPAEIATGKKVFPDIFSPGQIRDRGLHTAQSLGLENEYRAVMKLPSRPYGETLQDLVTYSNDPELTAYYNAIDEKYRFMKKLGRKTSGTIINDKSNALYNFKQALYYKDKEAAKRYLQEYADLGGTDKGLRQSLESKHPLDGLNMEEQVAFVKTLDREQILDLKRAIEHYEKVYGVHVEKLKKAK